MQKLSVILEAVDRVTKPITEVAARVKRLNSQLGMDKLASAGKKVGTSFGNVGTAAREMATRVTAATGLIGGGLFVLIKGAADAGDAANDLSQKIGLTAVEFQKLAYAAKMNGSNAEEMANGLRVLNRQMVDASTGNKTTAENFRRLGVTLRDTHGKLKPTNEVFSQIADKFEKMPDGAKKSALAMAIFGDAGANLVQTLNGGSAGLKQAADEAQRLGVIIGQDAVNASADFNDSFDRLVSSLLGVRNAVAGKLLPVLTPLINRLTDWIAANRDLIATRLNDFIQSLPALLDKVRSAATDLYDRISPIVAVFKAVVDWIGPVNSALIGLTAIVAGKLLVSLAQLTIAFGGLTRSIAVTSIGLAKLAFAPLIETVVSFVTALRYGVGIVEAFNIALAANPIGLVITAVAALAAGVYLLYKNWDKVGPWFSKLWDSVKGAFSGFIDWIEATFVNAITEAFDTLWQYISPIVDKLKSAIDLGKSTYQFFAGDGGSSTGKAQPGALGRFGRFGAANVPISSAGGRMDTGGTMEVRVMDERTIVTRAKPNDPRMTYSVDTGRVMAR